MVEEGSKATVPVVLTDAANLRTLVSDRHFTRALKRLADLRSFIIDETTIPLPNESSLGALNLLRYRKEGRPASEVEWKAFEDKTQALAGLLTESLRHQFARSRISYWVPFSAFCLTAVAAGSMAWAVHDYLKFQNNTGAALLLYMVWLIALGAVGSLSFIGMNALSIQQDITFKMNNKLMLLRATLGSLFALVLTLPFGFEVF